MMSFSLPHLISHQISHNSTYGVAVFCHKDAGYYPTGQGPYENLQEEREGAGGEKDPDSEEYPAVHHPINVALVELNSINYNGGELEACRFSWAPEEVVVCRTVYCPGPPAVGSPRPT